MAEDELLDVLERSATRVRTSTTATPCADEGCELGEMGMQFGFHAHGMLRNG